MTLSNYFSVSWAAPIVPSISLAGIPLGVSAEDLGRVLLKYIVDANNQLYKFENAPSLRLKTHGLDGLGNGGYSFSLFDDAVINELLKGTPALSIMIREGKVHAIKVYDFSFSGDLAQELVYKGVLPAGIGLGSLVSDLLPFTSLDFDSAEEWFYTDQDYGGLEVTGWGVPLEDHPDQIITALCVISGTIAQA
jgi:hypothetical protein